VLSAQQMEIHWANAKSLVHNGHTFIHRYILQFIINESIILGLVHSLGGHHVHLSDFAIDRYLPRFSQPLGKVQAIKFET
jgi:hypothetical protein